MSNKIAKASFIWGVSIALSRLIGLVREGVLGRTIGVKSEADAYFAAFVVPDYLNYLLAAGALSIVFIPIFAAHFECGEEREGWESFSAIASFLTVTLSVLAIVLWIAMPVLVPLVAPGFEPATQARVVLLSRIILPAQLFHVIGGLLSAALQARDRHALPAMAPLVYNFGVIAGGLIGGAEFGAEGFAWGVLAGSALGPFLLPWIGCRSMGLRWSFALDFGHPELRVYLARSLPIMLGFSIVAVDDWFLRREGSKLGSGAVSSLSYAKSLMKVPMAVFGVAAGVAAYPTLVRLAAEQKLGELRTTIVRTLRHLVLLSFASQAVLCIAAPRIVAVIYGRRSLDEHQVREIGTCLTFVSLGLVAWSVQTVLARGFYALGQTWLPAVLGTAVAVLAYPLYYFAGKLSGTHGLAFMSSAAILVYVALLAWKLNRRLPIPDRAELVDLRTFGAKAVVALAVGWAAGLVVSLPLDSPKTFVGALFQTALLSTATLIGFVVVAHQLGVPEITVWRDRLLARVRPAEEPTA